MNDFIVQAVAIRPRVLCVACGDWLDTFQTFRNCNDSSQLVIEHNTPATARIRQLLARMLHDRTRTSVTLFDHNTVIPILNDFASMPDRLLDTLLGFGIDDGTDLTLTILRAQAIMVQSWSTESNLVYCPLRRSPLADKTFINRRLLAIVFLSDGECRIEDNIMQVLCPGAIRFGKAVSSHAVSFGPDAYSASLCRMADIVRDVQNSAPRDPLAPTTAATLSSYTRALDTEQFAETFLGIAESLRKPRGAPMH